MPCFLLPCDPWEGKHSSEKTYKLDFSWRLHAHPLQVPARTSRTGVGRGAHLVTTKRSLAGATVGVYLPAGERRHWALKPAPPVAREPHGEGSPGCRRAGKPVPGTLAEALGRGRSAWPYPTCARALVRGCSRCGATGGGARRGPAGGRAGAQEPRGPGRTRVTRGAGAALL